MSINRVELPLIPLPPSENLSLRVAVRGILEMQRDADQLVVNDLVEQLVASKAREGKLAEMIKEVIVTMDGGYARFLLERTLAEWKAAQHDN